MRAVTIDEVKEFIINELPQWIETHPELRRKLAEAVVHEAEEPKEKAVPPSKMTYEEFLAWADEDTLAEWVDGEVVLYRPASDQHQNLADFLIAILRPYVESRNLGWVRTAPFQMKLEHGREPDLLYLSRDHLERLKETHLDGPADLVVEIVSWDSVARDRGKKFYEYEASGVREYWLLDHGRRWAEFYRLGRTGLYEVVFNGREGVYHSEVVPGFWLRVEWLWQDPLPAVEEVLLEVGGEVYAHRLIERLRQHGFLPTEE